MLSPVYKRRLDTERWDAAGRNQRTPSGNSRWSKILIQTSSSISVLVWNAPLSDLRTRLE